MTRNQHFFFLVIIIIIIIITIIIIIIMIIIITIIIICTIIVKDPKYPNLVTAPKLVITPLWAGPNLSDFPLYCRQHQKYDS